MKELRDLENAINMCGAYNKVAHELSALRYSVERKDKILETVHTALGQLRLDMKYLMFDLEATRRERDEALK